MNAPLPAMPPVDLHRHLQQALEAQWKCYGQRLGRCRKRLSKEAVHDLRVEVRRLLSTLELYNAMAQDGCAAKVRRKLKKRLDRLDKLRDTQVQLSLLKDWTGRYAAARALRRHLKRREKDCRKKAAREVTRGEAIPRRRSIKPMCAVLRKRRKAGCATRDWETVIRVTEKAFAKVKRLQRRARPDDAAGLHGTRIAFKKFRYMMESLRGLLPGITPDYLARLHSHQGSMGDIQDVRVLEAVFEEFVVATKINKTRQLALRTALNVRRRQRVAAYFERAGELSRFWPPPAASDHKPKRSAPQNP